MEVEQTVDQVTDESTPEQDDAAFEAGFGDGPGTQTAPTKRDPPATEATQTETEVEPPKTEEVAVPDKDDVLVEKLSQRLMGELGPKIQQHIDGRFGGINRDLKAALAAAKQTATASGQESPNEKQIAAAVTSTGKWKKFKEEFPDWVEAFEEHTAAELATVRSEIATKAQEDQAFEAGFKTLREQIAEAKKEARVYARIDLEAGEGWENTVCSQAFSEWFSRLPQDKQQTYDSDRASGVVAGLKEFQTYQAGVAQRQRRQGRLEAAVEAPTAKVGGPPVRSDDDAFVDGFEGR